MSAASVTGLLIKEGTDNAADGTYIHDTWNSQIQVSGSFLSTISPVLPNRSGIPCTTALGINASKKFNIIVVCLPFLFFYGSESYRK